VGTSTNRTLSRYIPGGHRIHAANPSDREYSRRSFILWFGCSGTTLVLVYADSLEDAVEEAAEYCAGQGWVGLVIPHEDPDPVGDGSDPFECEGLMHTESGWVSSYEWGIFAEDPTPAQISAIHHGRPMPAESGNV